MAVGDHPSFGDLETAASGVMPPELWTFVASGSGDEYTQRANVAAFERVTSSPRKPLGLDECDPSADLLGMACPAPIFMAPIGVLGICAQDGHGDMATARAAAATGVPMVASLFAADPLEDVAAECGTTPAFFQLYVPKDRDLTVSLVRRAEAAGYRGSVITLDQPMAGWRPRDLAVAYSPPLRGQCLANYTSDPVFRAGLAEAPERDLQATVAHWSEVFGNPLSWDDLPWLRSSTGLPLIVKGICHPDDARRARDEGVDGVYCSNHGGRHANGGLPAVDCLPAVAAAVDGLPVLFDSGVRSGADVVKALTLGATAVGIGRPYAYGLALGGTDGVVRVLRSLLADVEAIVAVDDPMSRNKAARLVDAE